MTEEKINPLKNYYVIVDKRGFPLTYTISVWRRLCIKEFIGEGKSITWFELRRKYGWRCVKVNIKIEKV